MSRGRMPYLQFYKGSWRVRRPIPKHLQPFLNRGSRLTHKLRRDGEPRLTNKPEAERRSMPVTADHQVLLDWAQDKYDTLYGPLEQTRIEEPVHRYRLRDPNDPTSGVEIADTLMVERFVKKSDLVKLAPAALTVPEPGTAFVAVRYDVIIERWLEQPQKNGRPHAPDARRYMAPMVRQFRDWLRANGHPAAADDMVHVQFSHADDYIHSRLAAINLALKTDGDHEDYNGKCKTLRNHLKMLTRLFGVAVPKLLPANPFQHVNISLGDGNTRPEHTAEERAHIYKLSADAEPYQKWFQRLGLAWGIQNAELADLDARDIEIVGETVIVHIQETHRKRQLKTPARVRNLPVPARWRDEFLEFVQSVPEGALFRDLPVNAGSRVAAFTYSVNEWLRDVAGAGTYYSHRHSVTSIMSNATMLAPDGHRYNAIGDDIQRYLMGHGAKEAHGKYGRRDQVQTLAGGIEIVMATLDDNVVPLRAPAAQKGRGPASPLP